MLTLNLAQELKEFCGSFDAGMKGLTLSNSDQVEKLSMFDTLVLAAIMRFAVFYPCSRTEIVFQHDL